MKRISLFPFVILLLTSTLIGGFFFAASHGLLVSTQESSAPDISTYRSSLASLVQKFVNAYDSSSDESARTQIVEQAMADLLSMRVPASERQIHLDVAVALQKIKQGFARNRDDDSDGYAELKQLINKTPWLYP